MKAFHSFEVSQKSGSQFTTVKMDGQELKGVTGVRISMGVDCIPYITVDFTPGEINVDLSAEMEINEKECLENV